VIRQYSVENYDRNSRPARIAQHETVADRQRSALEQRLEETRRVLLLRLDGLLAFRDHAHVLRPRTERAHDHVAVRRVRAEQMVRIRMVAPDDRFDFVFQRHAAASSRRVIPATGTGTQSGRWVSS